MRPVIRLLDKKLAITPKLKDLVDLLVNSAGRYCLMCETPLGSDACASARVHVPEHGYTIPLPIDPDPKKKIQTKEGVLRPAEEVKRLDWANAVLCCSACWNRQAGPNWLNGIDVIRAGPDAAGLLGKIEAGKMDDARSIAIYQAAAKTWIWPDSAEDGAGLIPFRGDDVWNMLTFDTGSYAPSELAKLGWVRWGEAEKKEWSKHKDWEATKITAVWLVPRLDLAEAERRRVWDTITGFDLNYCGPDKSDTRLKGRTDAYDLCKKELDKLEAALKSVTGGADVVSRALFEFTMGSKGEEYRKAIQKTGYWSVWAKAFVARAEAWIKIGLEPWAVRTFLIQLLVQYEQEIVDEDMLGSEGDELVSYKMVIDGTDVDRLPAILGGPL